MTFEGQPENVIFSRELEVRILQLLINNELF